MSVLHSIPHQNHGCVFGSLICPFFFLEEFQVRDVIVEKIYDLISFIFLMDFHASPLPTHGLFIFIFSAIGCALCSVQICNRVSLSWRVFFFLLFIQWMMWPSLLIKMKCDFHPWNKCTSSCFWMLIPRISCLLAFFFSFVTGKTFPCGKGHDVCLTLVGRARTQTPFFFFFTQSSASLCSSTTSQLLCSAALGVQDSGKNAKFLVKGWTSFCPVPPHTPLKVCFAQIYDGKLARHSFVAANPHLCCKRETAGPLGETFSRWKWTETAKLFPVGHRRTLLSR